MPKPSKTLTHISVHESDQGDLLCEARPARLSPVELLFLSFLLLW